MIKEFILPDLEPEKITKAELDSMTPNTRVDTVLDTSKIESLGIEITPYEDRLREIVKLLGENIREMDKNDLANILEQTATASRQRTVLNTVYEELYKQ